MYNVTPRHTPHLVGLLWVSDQADADTSTSQQTGILVAGGIRTQNSSKPAAVHPRGGHWDRPTMPTKSNFL